MVQNCSIFINCLFLTPFFTSVYKSGWLLSITDNLLLNKELLQFLSKKSPVYNQVRFQIKSGLKGRVVVSIRHFLDIQKQRVKLFCLLVRPWGIQARHGMEAGGVIYAHKNAVKSKECILRTPTTCKHAYILPHNMYEMMENND